MKIDFLRNFKDFIYDKAEIIASIRDEEKRIEILHEFHKFKPSTRFRFKLKIEEENEEYIFDSKLIIAVIQTLTIDGLKKVSKDYEEIIRNQYKTDPDVMLIPYLVISGISDEIVTFIKELNDGENSIVITRHIEKLLTENKLTMNNLAIIKEIKNLLNASQLSDSNDSNIKNNLMSLLLQSPNPIEQFMRVKSLFEENNIPYFIKQYFISKILFEKDGHKLESPMMQDKSDEELWKTIFSDLMQITLGSYNIENLYYIKNAKVANELFEKVKNGEMKFEDLNSKEQDILKQYLSKLSILLNFINFNNFEENSDYFTFENETNVKSYIEMLVDVYSKNGSRSFNMLDRAVELIMGDIGISTFNELINSIIKLQQESEQRHIDNASGFVIEEGDYIQGAGDIRYLDEILKNGVLAGEFLNVNAAAHDNTPFGADFSIIKGNSHNLKMEIEQTPSKGFGPVYFIIKKQTAEPFLSINGKEAQNKMELYPDPGHDYPQGDAYLIRTGCPSSLIDYIVAENNEDIIVIKQKNMVQMLFSTKKINKQRKIFISKQI